MMDQQVVEGRAAGRGCEGTAIMTADPGEDRGEGGWRSST